MSKNENKAVNQPKNEKKQVSDQPKERSSYVISAQIDRLKANIEGGKCNPYAVRNMIKKLEKELAERIQFEHGTA